MQRINGYRFTNEEGEWLKVSFDGEFLTFETEYTDPLMFAGHEVSQLKVAADEMHERFRNRGPSR
jgi:hypothetical protein